MDRRSTTGENVIDIDGLVKSIKNYDCSDGGPMYNKGNALPMIWRTKPNSSNHIISEPSIISIGPYHQGAPAVQARQKLKYECLYFVLSLNPEKRVADYLNAMKGLEQQVRSYYRDEIKSGRDEFLKMILLDGCFVLVSLLGIQEIHQPVANSEISGNRCEKKSDEIVIGTQSRPDDANRQPNIQHSTCHEDDRDDQIKMWWYYHFLYNDVLLVDNQIPFSVVQRIYELLLGGGSPNGVLYENAIRVIEGMTKCNCKPVCQSDKTENFHHLLHLCHMYFRPREEKPLQSDQLYLMPQSYLQAVNPWCCATEYHQAGIVLRKRECNDRPFSVLDIAFCDGFLQVPCLTIIHTITECLFRNLVAFEKSCPGFGNYITAYVLFWSQFMSTPEDVELLTKKGIVENQVNSGAEILNLFAELSKNVAFDFNCHYYLKPLFYGMEAHYKKKQGLNYRNVWSEINLIW